MEKISVRWGISWVAVGLVVSVLGLFNTTRDGLLMITLGFLVFSAAAVFYASGNGGRALGQLVLGFALFLASTFGFIAIHFEPMGAVPIWLGLIAAGANSLAGQSLSPLALLGQLIPIAVITVTNVTRQDLPVGLAVAILLVSAALCVTGSLIGRSLQK
jgi:hypothetical protein